jgi:hypothetical protein
METFALFKLVHLLLFVYWLGGDLGTYYASRFVTNPDLTAAQRGTALKIMAGCDQAPRICMTLIFASGLHMTWLNSMVQVSGAVVAGVWLVCLAWLAMVLLLHFRSDASWAPGLARFDFAFRIAVIVVTLAIGVSALIDAVSFIRPDWIAAKFLLFGALVACGLMIRVYLKPFGPAFARLMSEGPSMEVNATISTSLARCRPWVYAIWVGLLVAAVLSLRLLRL